MKRDVTKEYNALRKAALKTARDLLEIAEMVMPDSYFATDSRVKRAQKLVQNLKGKS